eukprot:902517_1
MAYAQNHGFKPDKVAEFKEAFDSWNTDGNAHLDQKEMVDAMSGLGVDINKLGDMIKQVDQNNDGNIDFNEFMAALWMVQSKGDASGFATMVKKQVELIAIKTASGGVKSYSQDEVTAFANHLNYCLGDDPKLKYLMPINPNNLDLMRKCADGCLIARFINMIEPDTIDWRAVNYKKKGGLNQYHVIENQNLNISAAKAIGLRIYNLSAEDLRDAEKNPILVLGFMWQAVKMQLLGSVNLKSHPELIALVNDGEDMNDLLGLPPEELLKRWVNYHLEKQEYPKRIKNFGSDVKDGKVYTVLLKSIGENKGCNMDPLEWKDDKKRANQVLTNAQKIGCKPFLTSNDIVAGNPKLNMAFVAQLFNTCPGLKEVDVDEQKELAGLLDDDEGDSREERAFRMWMNSLGIKNMYVNNLYEDCRGGLVLLKVIDKIEPGSVKWKKKVEKKPNNKFKKINNTNYAVDLGKAMKLSLVNIQGSDITARNKKLILGFTWQLMRYHLFKFLASMSVDGKKITDKDVLVFCNESVQKSDLNKKPQIKSFGDNSIASGVFFIYLVASIEPDIVNWDLVTDGENDEDQKLNAKYAISLARKMGAIVFLLPEDIVEVRSRMCMTFCASVMAEAYKRSGKMKKKKY